MAFTGILLDLDNTLYPYRSCLEAGKQAAWEQARERGYELDRDAFDRFYTQGRDAVKREVANTAAAHDRYLYFKRALDIHTGAPQPGDALELADAFWEGYMQEMELFDGVESTLRQLQEDHRIAVTTDLTTRVQLLKLQRLGIADHIDCLVTSEETGRDKPASVMFTWPLTELDLARDDAVMVGDSISSDIVGGNGVGLHTVLFNNDRTDLDGMEQPDARMEAFDELLDIVG